MPSISPAVMGLVVAAAFLALGIAAGGLGIWLANLYYHHKERRAAIRSMQAREDANRHDGHECSY